MKVRAAFVVACLVPACVAGSSLAATRHPVKVKPVCDLIVDTPGDPGPSYQGVPGDGNDDIQSADLAANAKTITGVVRLGALAQPDPTAPLGQAFFVKFYAKGTDSQLFLSARTYPTGTKFVYGYEGVDTTGKLGTSYTIGDGTGVIDTANKEVRISAPLAGFAAAGAHLTVGSKLTGLSADTWRIAGQGLVPSQSVAGVRVPIGGLLLPFDSETGTKNYVVGTPSCVKVGQ